VAERDVRVAERDVLVAERDRLGSFDGEQAGLP
jgi:hypothetical protein